MFNWPCDSRGCSLWLRLMMLMGKEMATHSSILAWRILWTEEPEGLQSMGSQRVGHDWATHTTHRMRGKVPDFFGTSALRCRHQDCLWDSVGLNYSQMDGWNDVVAEGDLKVQLCWWECKLVQPLGRTVWRFLKKLEIEELPYDPAIPLLGIHTKETRSERDTCTPMFIAALFIIARTWKQPRCPSADEWIRKLWYIYNMEFYSAIKKNSFESVLMRWMKLEPII